MGSTPENDVHHCRMPSVLSHARMPALVAVAVTLAAIGIASPAAAQSTERVAAPVIHLQVDRTVQPDEQVRILVLRLSKGQPVTIAWGDGATTRVSGTCAARRAAQHPYLCGTVARHSYSRSGSFRVIVSRKPAAAYRGLVHVSGATPIGAAPPALSFPDDAARTGSTAWRKDMLAQVNAIRQQAGVAPVVLCANLTSAAQDYATLMATKNHYGHVGLDGSQPWDRIAATGYKWSGAGENIAGGFDTTTAVMDGWRASPGHYANLVNPAYTHIGLGRALDASSTYHSYWVQDFGYGGDCPS